MPYNDIHLPFHLIVPLLVARLCFPEGKRQKAFWILFAANLIDLDHLLADPIYDPNRCSIGFHPLHSMIAIAIYTSGFLVPKFRLLAIGLVIHILLDWADCLLKH